MGFNGKLLLRAAVSEQNGFPTKYGWRWYAVFNASPDSNSFNNFTTLIYISIPLDLFDVLIQNVYILCKYFELLKHLIGFFFFGHFSKYLSMAL